MGINTCRTCGKDLGSDIRCPYCGKMYVDATDPDAEERLITLGQKNRMEIVKNIKNISTEIHIGGPLSDKSNSSALSIMKVKLAGGTDCYEKIVWADNNIWQDQEVNCDKTIPVSYKYNGKEFKEVVHIKTRRTDDYWKFGVKLENNLHLRFFLGTKDNYSKSDLIPLKLISTD